MLGNHVEFIEKAMDISVLKRKVTADNIANYNTPDFKASKVHFDQLFEDAREIGVKTTNGRHLPGLSDRDRYEVITDETTKERYDGNNVDLNQEMIEMVKNNHMFNVSVQSINKEFMLNKIAIGKL